MSNPGFNSRYGWNSGPDNPAGDNGMQQGFFPAPPGYTWVDIGSVGPPYPWNQPGNMHNFAQQWQQHTPWAQPGLALAGNLNDGGFPGINFQNSHGGIGMEPGYNYIFPQDHCKIHVIISKQAPWLNNGPYEQKCFNVPTGITVMELMKQFGCDNKDPQKNKLHEVTQGGNGVWYKGITLCGDEKKQMEKKIQDVGWNTTRNGVDQDFVWLYFTKA